MHGESFMSAKKLNSTHGAEPPYASVCPVLRQRARAVSCLLVKCFQLKVKFPYEKYLRFPSHLLPAQLRCFPRDAAFLLALQLRGTEMERSGALVPLLAFIFPRRSNVTGNRYFSVAWCLLWYYPVLSLAASCREYLPSFPYHGDSLSKVGPQNCLVPMPPPSSKQAKKLPEPPIYKHSRILPCR